MKCLSIKQDWAAYVALGAKLVENRTWATAYRGPLLIHAGKGEDPFSARLTDAQLDMVRDARQGRGVDELETAYARGAIIAKVELYKVLDPGFRTWCSMPERVWWEPGAYGLTFINPVLFPEPIPYWGQRGVFEVPDEVIPEGWR